MKENENRISGMEMKDEELNRVSGSGIVMNTYKKLRKVIEIIRIQVGNKKWDEEHRSGTMTVIEEDPEKPFVFRGPISLQKEDSTGENGN